MDNPLIIQTTWKEGEPAQVKRRATAPDGTGSAVDGQEGLLILRADISSIAWASYDLDHATDPSTVIGSGSLSPVATYWFDTLQTWTYDSTGCNLKALIPATAFPTTTAGHIVRLNVTVTLTSGNAYKLIWEGPVLNSVPG